MPKEKNYYQLKIQAKDLRPSIFRTILVSSDNTFLDLHDYIQSYFGLESYHLWEFHFSQKILGRTLERSVGPKLEDDWDAPDDYAEKTKLKDLFKTEKDKMIYWYDFGGDWKFIITLQKIIPQSILKPEVQKKKLPLLIKAQGPMLLEDCGGNWGFKEILWAYEVIQNKKDIPLEEIEYVMSRVVCIDEPTFKQDFIDTVKSLHDIDWDDFTS